jgi:hypothetical protein
LVFLFLFFSFEDDFLKTISFLPEADEFFLECLVFK